MLAETARKSDATATQAEAQRSEAEQSAGKLERELRQAKAEQRSTFFEADGRCVASVHRDARQRCICGPAFGEGGLRQISGCLPIPQPTNDAVC